MSHHVIEFDQECKSCGATGLYVGCAEHDGLAVVCSTCKGTGKHHVKIEFDDFEGRKKKNVKWVLEGNPGIVVGLKGKDSSYRFEDFGGQSYTDWLADRSFPAASEMRQFTCPAWWYQSADYDKKPKWSECDGWGCFSDCWHFRNKEKCWQRFDKEAS